MKFMHILGPKLKILQDLPILVSFLYIRLSQWGYEPNVQFGRAILFVHKFNDFNATVFVLPIKGFTESNQKTFLCL